ASARAAAAAAAAPPLALAPAAPTAGRRWPRRGLAAHSRQRPQARLDRERAERGAVAAAGSGLASQSARPRRAHLDPLRLSAARNRRRTGSESRRERDAAVGGDPLGLVGADVRGAERRRRYVARGGRGAAREGLPRADERRRLQEGSGDRARGDA